MAKTLAGLARRSSSPRLTGVRRARPIMYDDHYGWFERAGTGVYTLSPKGLAALDAHAPDSAILIETVDAAASMPAAQ